LSGQGSERRRELSDGGGAQAHARGNTGASFIGGRVGVRLQAFASKTMEGRERGGPDRGKACGGTARRAAQQGHDMVRRGFPCELVGVGVWGTGAARPSCPSGRRGSDAKGAAAPCGGAHARPRARVFHSVYPCLTEICPHWVYPCLTEICSKISNQTSKTLNSKL
jgi:hypothetical protein